MSIVHPVVSIVVKESPAMLRAAWRDACALPFTPVNPVKKTSNASGGLAGRLRHLAGLLDFQPVHAIHPFTEALDGGEPFGGGLVVFAA